MVGKWICYKGDWEIYLAEKVQTRRFQRDFPIAPFWRVDSPYHNVRFTHTFTLKADDTLTIESEGRISVAIAKPDPYTFVYGFDGTLKLQAGEYELEIWVYNECGLPALKVSGNEVVSDETWQCGFNQFMMLPCCVCDCGEYAPSTYHLPVREIAPVSVCDCEGGKLYDFGKMRMAYPKFSGCESVDFRCYFGETLAEAMSDADCEQIDFFRPENGAHTTPRTQAFQFMRVVTPSPYSLSVYEEYDDAPIVFSFRADDKEVEKIAEISRYTFSLCSREFYLDGIKRDRWIWAGDAYLGAKIDYYTAFDCAKIKRTVIALLGKSPVVTYINHIMDYTPYTFLTAKDYYEHTGDVAFLRQIYPMLTEHLRFVLSRRNQSGFLYKQENDWVHVDWNDSLNTDGEVCFEQILLWAMCKAYSMISAALGENADECEKIADTLQTEINNVFWDEKRGAYRHSRIEGKAGECVTAYANVFALLTGFADENRKSKITCALLHDNSIPLITTPYMQAFLLSCLCEAGEFECVRESLRDYFGNMASTGTSTFWETYKIGEQKESATDMYGRPFGRSQCHIWGAGAILIIGKYFYGLKNDTAFGERFVLQPYLPAIENTSATLPLKHGKITVSYYGNTFSVRAEEQSGELRLNGVSHELTAGKTYTFDTKQKAAFSASVPQTKAI